MTPEQEKVIAIASARKRMAEQKPETIGFQGALKNEVINTGKQWGRVAGLTGRAAAEGVADVASPFADAAAIGANFALKAAGLPRLPANQSQAFSEQLTKLGLPTPQTTVEKISNFGGRLGVSAAASAGASNVVLKGMGLPTQVTTPAKPATTEAGKILQREGIPLDKSQAYGGRFRAMLRSALSDNPITANKQEAFTKAQQKAFNKSVLKSIGASSDEASQGVMLSAKKRIGSVFDSIGSKGTTYDDVLESDLSTIMDDAIRTVPKSELSPLQKNIDDLLQSAGKGGKIDGNILIQIRSRLSNLSTRPGIGEHARNMEEAIIDSLERSHPGQKKLLMDAKDQWRNLKVIEKSIDKGISGDISPSRLANAFAEKSQRAASVYGQGGDQRLIELAKAGKTVLPEQLPQSGTVPRGLMQATLRSSLQGALLKPAQYYMLKQPTQIPTYGEALLRKALIPTGGALMSRDY